MVWLQDSILAGELLLSLHSLLWTCYPVWGNLLSKCAKSGYIYRLQNCNETEWRISERTEVKVAQSCPTLCDPMNYTVHEVLQARILECVAFPFSRGSSQARYRTRSPTLLADTLPLSHKGKEVDWKMRCVYTMENWAPYVPHVNPSSTLDCDALSPGEADPCRLHHQGTGTLWLALLLLLLSHFSRVRLCATPETTAHQAPPSLGFSRQEHWSGLPFPSPMHESEEWKWSRSVVSGSPWVWPIGSNSKRMEDRKEKSILLFTHPLSLCHSSFRGYICSLK